MSLNERQSNHQIPLYIKGQDKIGTLLANTGLRFTSIDDARVRVLEGRDAKHDECLMPKKPNRYVHEDFPVMTEGNFSRVAIRAGDLDLGYAVYGVYKAGSKRIGELAMVRVSPVVKGFGLGSAIVNYGISQVLDQGIDVLRMEIADKTGKVSHLAESFGLSMVGSTPGIKGNVIVERALSSNLRSSLQEQAEIASLRSLMAASSNESLWGMVDSVEKDNPLRVDVVGLIESRVRTSNYKKPGQTFDVVYLGYPGARLMVSLVRAGDDSQVVEASVKGPESNKVRRILGTKLVGFSVEDSDFGLGEDFRGSVLRSNPTEMSKVLEDLVPLTTLSVDLIHQIEAEKFVGG